MIPVSLQQVFQELHVGHQGIFRMKALARSYVWRPKLDTNLELLVSHVY